MPAPKRSLGQHFLINPGVSQKIIDLLHLQAIDQILEIGPGPGALTRFLCNAPHSRLILIEKDSFYANQRKADAEVLEMDALQFDWAGICNSGIWKITGNLPYNIASPLIWEILGKCRCWQRAVFMVQKEVGQRICAKPDSRIYGALSVWCQAHALVKYEFTVQPGSFKPPPKVDSAVISFLPLSEQPQHPGHLRALLALAFQQRRKQLGNIFKQAHKSQLLAALSQLNIDPHLRPENLAVCDFLHLASFLAEN